MNHPPHLRLVGPEETMDDTLIPQTEPPLSTPTAPMEPVRSALIGQATSAASGALVGGVAGGTWQAALLGASMQGGLYSGFELLRTWESIGVKTKTTLGVGAIMGVGFLGMVLLRRHGGRRRRKS